MSRLVDFGSLPSGTLALVSLIVGFVVSLPFQTSTVGADLAKSTGLPINSIAANQLHYADLAYVVGFVVAFVIFWLGSRSMADRPVEQEATTTA